MSMNEYIFGLSTSLSEEILTSALPDPSNDLAKAKPSLTFLIFGSSVGVLGGFPLFFLIRLLDDSSQLLSIFPFYFFTLFSEIFDI